MLELEIQEGSQTTPVQCACCGKWSQCINGFVYEDGIAIAAYFVHWTKNNLDHDPNFDLIIGSWGDGASANDRYGVSLVYRIGQGFMVIDAETRPYAKDQTLFSHVLKRSEVIGSNIASISFQVVDAILLKDGRLCELREAAN